MMCNVVHKPPRGGRLQALGIESNNLGNVRFYWDDQVGNRYYFNEATQKQARIAARASARMLLIQDDGRSLHSTILEEMQYPGTVSTAEIAKELRLNIIRRFDQFHPTNRQMKIGLVIARELIDCLLGYFVKYVDKESTLKLAIHWEIEYLPGDGGIYQMLLKGGGNEADTGVHNN